MHERGFYIVTASVDRSVDVTSKSNYTLMPDSRLDVLTPLLPVKDIRLSGIVIYTGTSSMEVAIKMEAINASGMENTLLLGR